MNTVQGLQSMLHDVQNQDDSSVQPHGQVFPQSHIEHSSSDQVDHINLSDFQMMFNGHSADPSMSVNPQEQLMS